MKTSQLIIWTILALAFQSTYGQQLYKCDTTKSYWTFEKDSSFFAVKLLGNAKEQDRKSVISVGSFALQYVIVDKKNYIKEDADTSGLKVLIKYALSEAEYFTSIFKQKINIQLQKVPLSSNRSVLLWFFEMPSNVSKDVKHQVFANIIIGDKIVGLSSSQFSDQKFDDVKNFLIDIISTLKKFDSKKDFEKLCGQ
jgi:hypothetical protein